MKKKELILTAAVLAAALILWGISRIFLSSSGDVLRITVDNKIFGEYSLLEEQTIAIGDTNVCQIQDGEVTMTQADCPDQICVKSAPITKKGGQIVCLPNRVFLEVIPENGEGQPDVTAS